MAYFVLENIVQKLMINKDIFSTCEMYMWDGAFLSTLRDGAMTFYKSKGSAILANKVSSGRHSKGAILL